MSSTARNSSSSGKNGKVIIVFAVTDPEAGKGISAFIVPTDTPGYQVVSVEHKLGQHSSDTLRAGPLPTCACRWKTASAPRARATGSRWRTSRRSHRHRGAGGGHGARRLSGGTGLRRRRITFGKPIADHQAIAFKLADMATQIDAGRLLVHRAARLREAGMPC